MPIYLRRYASHESSVDQDAQRDEPECDRLEPGERLHCLRRRPGPAEGAEAGHGQGPGRREPEHEPEPAGPLGADPGDSVERPVPQADDKR